MYDQIWRSDDLNPDRLTNEINKLFTLNNTDTTKTNHTNIFFNINSESLHSSSKKTDVGGAFDGIFSLLSSIKASLSTSGSSNDESNQKIIIRHTILCHLTISNIVSVNIRLKLNGLEKNEYLNRLMFSN